MLAVGKEEGINFALDKIKRTPNTLDAHRLVWLADQEGIQDAVMEATFRAYFTEGRDIRKRQTLIDVVVEAGLDRNRAEVVLSSDEGLEAIKEADETFSAISSRRRAVLHRQRQDHAGWGATARGVS